MAILVGCAVAAIPTLLQPHFKAGSFPDFVCEMLLLPGKLVATPFHDRGDVSPEFLWCSRAATATSLAVCHTAFFTTENALRKALYRSSCNFVGDGSHYPGRVSQASRQELSVFADSSPNLCTASV